MNKTDFYKRFAVETGMSQRDAKAACFAMFDILAQCINEEDRVYINGFGTFKKKTVPARRIGNLYGDEPITIPARTKVVFNPSDCLLDQED